MKRIFIGIKIEADRNLRKLISGIQDDLSGESIKWTDPENIHITLAFIGETPEEKIDAISRMLREKVEGKCSFEISLKGFGVFKNLHIPKVLWAGIYQSDKLNTLQESIASGLKDIDIHIEDRAFSPHLTIGRIKHIDNRDNLKILLLKHHSTDIQRVNVENVILYESILRPEGPEYKKLSVFKL